LFGPLTVYQLYPSQSDEALLINREQTQSLASSLGSPTQWIAIASSQLQLASDLSSTGRVRLS